MSLRLSPALLPALLFFLFGSTIAGQESRPGAVITPRQRPAMAVGRPAPALVRSQVKVVLVPVSVCDELNRPVTNLTKNRFRVLEDGLEQSITSFEWEDGPVSLGLLLDTSGSMKNRMEASVSALRQVFQTEIRGDEYFLVQFSDDVRQLVGFTDNPDVIDRRLFGLQANGWTALLDAVAFGTHQLTKSAKNPRKVLLVLSDGNDNNSRFTESEVRNRVMEADVRIYGIGLGYRPRLLQRLAEETGGNVLLARDVSELPEVVRQLSMEIRSHYVLGYTPLNDAADGKYRKLTVELLQPPGASSLRAYWRRGYYSEGW
jgi:Ca-activated chloride channel family protein